jgi:AcrR family transcriptional regulator
MKKRAAARDETRERIIRATMALHDEQGVATTTHSDIAERAGVGPATVYRNFPTPESLVQACGAHVWQEMRPPTSEAASTLFVGLVGREQRLERLVQELDAFYRRGEFRMVRAGQDRDRVPALDFFLNQIDAGIEAWVREALRGDREPDILLARALTDFHVWRALQRVQLPQAQLIALMLHLLSCSLTGGRQ